jgi:hypothetical protein
MKSRQFNTVEQPFNINHNQTIQGSENFTENEKPRSIIRKKNNALVPISAADD